MPTSTGNPAILAPLEKSSIAGGQVASGQPLTGFDGIRLIYPMNKMYLTGAVRRDMDGVQFGAGATLSASTAYSGYCIVPRNFLVTAIYLVAQTMPTVAASFNVTYNGTTILLGGPISIVSSSYAAGQIYSIPLITSGSLVVTTLPDATGQGGKVLPYLTTTNGAGGFPYPLLCTYTEGASGTHSTNVNMFVEFEPDDFNG
jgi:hypothetical protein